MDYKKYISIIENFPVKGISFKDITPLLANGEAFKSMIDEMVSFAKEVGATKILGPESRGFIFGCPVANALGIGFVPIRKPGKLPREAFNADYDLEYGTNTLCMHKDALSKDDKVLIIDDLIATGGTIKATIDLVNQAGAKVVGTCYAIELTELHGKDKFKEIPYKAVISYPF